MHEIFSNFFYWLLQIVPPLFILPLAAIPLDLPSAILWGPAQIASIWSIVNIINFLFNFLKKKVAVQLSTLTRPALTLAMFTFAMYSINHSFNTALSFARAEAVKVQQKCKSGSCPLSIDGWKKNNNPNSFVTMHGWIAKYSVFYTVSDDAKEFFISVHRSVDMDYIIHGGVEKELPF